MALQFETEQLGETYTIVAGEGGYMAELAGTLRIIRCRVHDDEQPNLQAEFDFQVHTRAEDGSKSAFLRAVKVESLPRDHPIDAAPITISTVRDWPLTRWESAARAMVSLNADTRAEKEHLEKVLAARRGRKRDESPTEEEKRRFRTSNLLLSVFPEIADSGDTPGERRHWNGIRKLAEAAVLYRELVAYGRPDPAAEIARIKNVSPATARSWIYRARQVGLLGPAVGRTAGEAPDREKAKSLKEALRPPGDEAEA